MRCASFEVEAKELPFVVREEDAKEDTSPRVWEDTRIFRSRALNENGEVDKAFAECAAVVEGFYTTPVQIHHPLETHGNTVSWTDEGVTCWASTQGITSVHDGLARQSESSPEPGSRHFRIHGWRLRRKIRPGVEGSLAARLSKEAKAPVKLMLTRFDQALAVGNRPSSFQKIKLGAKADGKLARV